MTYEGFNKLKNFKADEMNYKHQIISKTEDIELVKPELMFRVDSFVTYIKKHYNIKKPEAIIHCITSGKHVNQSYHYKGMAIDLHITHMSLYDIVMAALLFNFGGVGFYPFSAHFFIHLDVREIIDYKKFWFRNEDGIYISATHNPSTVFGRLCGTE